MTSRPSRHAAASVAATLLCVSAAWIVLAGMDDQATPAGWFKGNTHTHTINSDGDSTPDDVVRWYREHQYQFLVLTDHNFLTSVDGLNALHGAAGKFLVIPGEEVTDRFGEALLEDGGAGLVVRVRVETDEKLARGDRAVIVGYDEDRQEFTVAPMDDGLGDPKSARARH